MRRTTRRRHHRRSTVRGGSFTTSSMTKRTKSSGTHTLLSQLEPKDPELRRQRKVLSLLREQKKMQAEIDARNRPPPRMYSRVVGPPAPPPPPSPPMPSVWAQLTQHGLGPKTVKPAFSRVIAPPVRSSSSSSKSSK